MRAAGVVARIVALVAYPFLVWFGLSRGSTRICALGTAAVALVALSTMLRGSRGEAVRAVLVAPALLLASGVLGAVFDDARFVLVTPVLVNGVLLSQFVISLGSMPMVERFARLANPALPDDHVPYCRSVTKVWCAYFVLNGGTAAALAALGWIDAWTLHTGVLGYVGMGVLGAGEYIVRKARFREFGTHWVDRLLVRLLGDRASCTPAAAPRPEAGA